MCALKVLCELGGGGGGGGQGVFESIANGYPQYKHVTWVTRLQHIDHTRPTMLSFYIPSIYKTFSTAHYWYI